MALEFKLPELGENIESASVLKVLVNVGDTISKDQPVVELETDKATIEVPSTVGGVVKEIRVKEGGKATVGQVVLTVDSDGAPAAEQPVAKAKEKPAAEKKAAAKAPKAKSGKAGKKGAAPAPAPSGPAVFKIPE